MNLVGNTTFFSLTKEKEVVKDSTCSRRVGQRGYGERQLPVTYLFNQEQKYNIVQAMNVIELLQSVQGAKRQKTGKERSEAVRLWKE